MLISEIFHSIQGEGALTGVPSVFVRTSGCNLRCRWCDTPYASWSPEGSEMSVDQILDEVRRYPARHCVLTGGEPMVARGIHDLAERLRAEGYHITIETAGTLPPDGIACDLTSLSPKLAHSTPEPSLFGEGWTKRHDSLRLLPDVLRQWIGHGPFQLKFVLQDKSQISEIDALLDLLDCGIEPHHIQILPEGTTSEKLAGRAEELVSLCLERGFRFCHRLHIELFGNTRGT